MNVFEKREALINAKRDLECELFTCEQKIKTILEDFIRASPAKAMTAYDLSLKTGLSSRVIAQLLFAHPKTKTKVERTYAMVLPDGTVDHDRTVCKSYEACLYHLHDDEASSSPFEGLSYQGVFDEILKNLKA